MKKILLFTVVLMTQAVLADSSGMYKLVQESVYESPEEIIFLVNSNDEVKNIGSDDNDRYYEISIDRFFSEVTLSFEGGGDEDWIEGIVVLDTAKKEIKTRSSCSAAVDGPNGYIRDIGYSTKLYKWSKKKKKFEKIAKTKNFTDCFDEIAKKYPDFEL